MPRQHEYLRVMASIGVYAHLASEAEMLEAAGKDFAAANTSGSGELNVYEFMSFYQHLEAHMRGVHVRASFLRAQRAVARARHFGIIFAAAPRTVPLHFSCVI
jgi:hypothetical protein